MKKLVIFDLDGTLIDSTKGLTNSMNFALNKLNLKEISEAETKKNICYGTEKFALYACRENKELANQCHEIFLQHYTETSAKSTNLCVGIPQLLLSLRNREVHTAILTNKPQVVADSLVKVLFKNHKFDCVIGQSESIPLKPSNLGINKILRELNINREDAMLVGDGETDAKTAINSGIDFIGVLWGNRTKKELRETGAVYFAKNTKELLNIILYKYGKKHISRIYEDFKKFITKGNVLDMAVGVIIGGAFTAIVNSLVKDIINPAVSIVTGGISLSELKWILRPAKTEIIDGIENITKPAVTLNYGAFIQAILNFLLVALTVFAIVKFIMTLRKKLDYNENIRHRIQKKLDNDEVLSRKEKRWMIRQNKKDKEHLPRKTVKVIETVKPTPPPEPILTDKLLMEILSEIKSKK